MDILIAIPHSLNLLLCSCLCPNSLFGLFHILLYAKYKDKLHFIIIYTREGNPARPVGQGPNSTDKEGNPIYQPQTYGERLELARMTVAEEDLEVPVLVDEIDNPVWCTYGPAPNIAYLIAKDGTIYKKQDWFQPEQMELAILDYLAEYDE